MTSLLKPTICSLLSSSVAITPLTTLIPPALSQTLTPVPTSPQIEQQTIPNCWMYAVTAWLESLRLSGGYPTENFSESYLLYRHFENQLLLAPPSLRKLQTGARWQTSAVVMSKYGLMYAKDFIPEEATNPKSTIMPLALAQLHRSMRSGPLSRDRSPATIRSELDRAFGVTLADLEAKIIPANQLPLEQPSGNAEPATLQTALQTWKEHKWPSDPQAQKLLLGRVTRSLNKGTPIPMSWFVDFGARSEDGIFTTQNLQPGSRARQGGHLVVLVDHENRSAATDVVTTKQAEDSLTAPSFIPTPGPIPRAFIAKNSWGETGYQYRNSRGFLKIETDYLTSTLDERLGSRSIPTTGLSSFILPPQNLRN